MKTKWGIKWIRRKSDGKYKARRWRWNFSQNTPFLDRMYWLPFGNGRISDNPNLVEKTPDNLDRTLITSWSNHYNSWKNLPLKKIIVKYEDLIYKPEETFLEIVEYLNHIIDLETDLKLVKKSIDNVKFNNLVLFIVLSLVNYEGNSGI